jgi:hypothetical protein
MKAGALSTRIATTKPTRDFALWSAPGEHY